MCQSALEQVGALATALEPDLVDFETAIGVSGTTSGQAAITAFDTLAADLKNWTPGSSTGQTVEEAVAAFNDVFQTLPIPTEAKGIEGVIEAGVAVILGFVVAHPPTTPAAAPADSNLSPADTLAAHQAETVAAVTAKVQKLVPGWKLSKFHTAVHQYRSEMNKAVSKAGPKYASLKR